jgi:hypothetical protein
VNAGDPRTNHPGDPLRMPIDLEAVRADDQLLDLMRDPDVVAQLVRDKDDEFLVEVLTAWRHEALTAGTPDLVDVDLALAAIEAGRINDRALPPFNWLRRHNIGPWQVLTATGALLIIAFCTLGLISHGSEPGDLLYPLHELLYPRPPAPPTDTPPF